MPVIRELCRYFVPGRHYNDYVYELSWTHNRGPLQGRYDKSLEVRASEQDQQHSRNAYTEHEILIDLFVNATIRLALTN